MALHGSRPERSASTFLWPLLSGQRAALLRDVKRRGTLRDDVPAERAALLREVKRRGTLRDDVPAQRKALLEEIQVCRELTLVNYVRARYRCDSPKFYIYDPR